ncbi:MAG: hypothetical protein RL757_3346 [Bacteroidota bacterium]|jgi:hypothetical protein
MLKIPTSARIGWNSFDDKIVQRDDQESVFLATFDHPATGELYKFQIDYSYYNRGRFEAEPKFILHVYACGQDFENYSDTVNYIDKEYDLMDDAAEDINHWLQFFHEKVSKIMLEETFPKDLILSQKLIYDPLNLEIKNIQREKESAEYEAFTFQLNNSDVIYRTAKITPVKNGQFTALWKREKGEYTEPFQISDDIDFVIISTRKDNLFGQFIFPKSILVEKKVIATKMTQGKRALRVYPPWDLTENRQAKASQKWQLNYFLTVTDDEKVDLERAKILMKIK